MIKTIRRADLVKALGVPPQYEILLVLALGTPKEVVVMDPVEPGGSVEYWRDGLQVHHVPKRELKDIIIGYGEREVAGKSQR